MVKRFVFLKMINFLLPGISFSYIKFNRFRVTAINKTQICLHVQLLSLQQIDIRSVTSFTEVPLASLQSLRPI